MNETFTDGAAGTAAAEMPKYRCHKEVWALKIAEVIDPTKPGNESDGSRVLRFEGATYAPMRVPHSYVRKHDPQAGGYYVVYEDGYASFSPAKAFEDGYTRIAALQRAALLRRAGSEPPPAFEKNGISLYERVVCIDVPRVQGTVIACNEREVRVRWDDGTIGDLAWNDAVAYNAYRLQVVRAGSERQPRKSTPEGLCTACSATQYCTEHDPAVRAGSDQPEPLEREFKRRVHSIVLDNIEVDEDGICCRVCELDGYDNHAPECPIGKLWVLTRDDPEFRSDFERAGLSAPPEPKA